MKTSRLILFFTISFFVLSVSAKSQARRPAVEKKQAEDWQDSVNELSRLIKKNDFLGVRVLVKKLGKEWPEKQEWSQVRRLLHESPKFGWDLLRFWETIQPRTTITPQQSAIDNLIMASHQLLSQKKFEEAFSGYQKAAKMIKADNKNESKDNRELSYFLLRQMSEALYGAGRFEDALSVNLWIPPIYSDYKTILFERMWIAFRAGRIDIANGAIAGQYSSYFGTLEPESYLVQMYIYRKMCRDSDYGLLMKNLKNLQKKLKTKGYAFTQWLKSDFQRRPYLSALLEKKFPSSDRVSDQERTDEKKKLHRILMKEFAADKTRLISEIERVFAYAKLATSASSTELPKVQELPPQTELLKSGLEMWPVSDGEDWLDELGQHIFIGDSQCKSQPSSK